VKRGWYSAESVSVPVRGGWSEVTGSGGGSRQVSAVTRDLLAGVQGAATMQRRATSLQRSGSQRQRNAALARRAPVRRRPEIPAAAVYRVQSPDMTSRTVALDPSRGQNRAQYTRSIYCGDISLNQVTFTEFSSTLKYNFC